MSTVQYSTVQYSTVQYSTVRWVTVARCSPRAQDRSLSLPCRGAAPGAGAGHWAVRLAGLVWTATEEDVRSFLRDCSITRIRILRQSSGRPKGEAVVELDTPGDVRRAVGRSGQYLGQRFVIVTEISADLPNLAVLNRSVSRN